MPNYLSDMKPDFTPKTDRENQFNYPLVGEG